MKFKIFLHREDAPGVPKIQLKAEMKNAAPNGEPWTCNSLFLDFLSTPQATNYELKKWKLRRDRDKWNGLASDVSPALTDNDEVTFYAARKSNA